MEQFLPLEVRNQTVGILSSKWGFSKREEREDGRRRREVFRDLISLLKEFREVDQTRG